MGKRQRQSPPKRTPLQQGQHDFRGCLWVLLSMMIGGGLFAVLLWWGGLVGRMLIYPVGFGMAGLLAPFVTDTYARSHNQERFMFYFGIFLAICGVIYGVWAAYANEAVKWWVNALAGLGFVVASGWLAHRGTRSISNAECDATNAER